MPYELFISLRYLIEKRKQGIVLVTSVISIIGVKFGVAALIIVLAVMAGVKNDIQDKILGIMPHILIQKPVGNIEESNELPDILDQIHDIPFVVDSSPYVSGQVLISSEANVSGVKLHGIDPERKTAVADLEKTLREGSIDQLKIKHDNLDSPRGPKRDGIIIGRELSRFLGVFPGDDVTLILPAGRVLPTGPVPKLRKFRVVGIFHSEFYEYDSGLAYISLTSAQKFFSIGKSLSGLEIRLDDIYQSRSVTREIRERLKPAYHVQDWTEMNKSLFSAINLEKLGMFLILALIILVAAFNIITTLVMMVMERHSDIATLKSMGATSNSIMKIFMFEGLIIGIVGTVFGTIVGIVVCWIADTYKLIRFEGGVYYLDHLPFTVTALDLVLVIVSALIICFVSTIYPARQASRLDPIAVLRYE